MKVPYNCGKESLREDVKVELLSVARTAHEYLPIPNHELSLLGSELMKRPKLEVR
jgi:hypothetical protein